MSGRGDAPLSPARTTSRISPRHLGMMVALLSLWVLASWMGARRFFDARLVASVERTTAQAEERADELVREIAQSLSYLHGLPAVIAESRAVQGAMAGGAVRNGPPATPGPIDAYLASAARDVGADVVWLLDASGTCIAASNAGTPESFVGVSYAAREYFQVARAGGRGSQYAVGMRTRIPGLYFSAPIERGGRFAGVLVVKMNLSRMAFWTDQAQAVIADPYGVIIMATDPRLVMHALPGAFVDEMAPEARQERYAQSDFPPLRIEPWGDARVPQLRRIADRPHPTAWVTRPMPEEGTNVFVMASVSELADLDREFAGLFLLLSVAGAALIVAVDGRIHNRRMDRDAKRALEASEARFRTAFKGSPDAILITRSSDGVCVAANDGFTAILGYTEAEAVGRSVLDLAIWADPAERKQVVEAADRDGEARIETHFRHKDGTLRLGALSARRMEVDGVPHLLTVARDVTAERRAAAERHRLEEQLRQSQKMESMGRLAGGVAHDFNNLLSVILGYASSLRASLPDGAERSEAEEIERAGRRAGELTRQLLAFSRKQVLRPEALEVREAVGSIIRMLGRLIGENIEIRAQIAASTGYVYMDPSQFEQVLVNLAVNARDAMPGGGVLGIEGSPVEVGPSDPPRSRPLAYGPYVQIRVSDTGTGMDATTVERAFEPFFTTKEKGRGTGLGLSMVYGALQQSGGDVEVASRPGEGTTFTILLPSAPAPASRATGARNAPVPRGRGERVLLVEDDPQVHETVRRLLTEGGYQVVGAMSGEEGLATFGARGAEIDLVITDLVMPGVGGLELGRVIRGVSAVPVLYMTGYSEEMASGASRLAPEELLMKPFDRETLLARVRGALGSTAGRSGARPGLA